ncbi:MAG: hypothetical protein ABUU24_09975, partial [Variovorax sp.]
RAATESAANGFRVIVYGHTHLPKKISLRGREAADGRTIESDAVYLNSGTWADLMAVPDAVLDGDPSSDDTLLQLRAFADDLAANRVDAWRRLLPTFVDVSIDGERVTSDVRVFGEGAEPESVTTELIRDRLQGSKP